MMSLGPVVSVSYVNFPLEVSKTTEDERMPVILTSVDSMRLTQESQYIPVICDKDDGYGTCVEGLILVICTRGVGGLIRSFNEACFILEIKSLTNSK